jgi:hypothetical protein
MFQKRKLANITTTTVSTQQPKYAGIQNRPNLSYIMQCVEATSFTPPHLLIKQSSHKFNVSECTQKFIH